MEFLCLMQFLHLSGVGWVQQVVEQQSYLLLRVITILGQYYMGVVDKCLQRVRL